MKILLSAACVFGVVDRASADVKLSETFDSYNVGTLAGQGGWTATTAAATPIQVAGGSNKIAAVGTSGQDDYKAFTSTVANTGGNSLYYGFTTNFTSVQTNGDYFAHVSNPAGTTGNFYGRVFAKSATGGLVLGFVDNSGTGSTITYGTTVLSLSTDYRVTVKWNFVEGLVNDTFSVFVSPASGPITEGTAYLNHTWTSASAEPTVLAAFNLRQGTGTAAPALSVDDILVGTTFADVVPTPEPSSLAFIGLSGLTLLRRRRLSNA